MANDFIIVIFPCNESLLFDQVLIVFSTFFKISVVLWSHMYLFLNLFLTLSKTFLEHNVFLNCSYILFWNCSYICS